MRKFVTITGHLASDAGKYKNVYYSINGMLRESVAVDDDGEFRISFPFKKAAIVNLSIGNHVSFGLYRSLPVLVDEPGIILVGTSKTENEFYNAKLSGIESAVLYQEFLEQNRKGYKRSIMEREQYLDAVHEGKIVLEESIALKVDSIARHFAGITIKDFMKKNPGAFVSVYILENYGKGRIEINDYEEAYECLSNKNKRSVLGKKSATYMAAQKNASNA